MKKISVRTFLALLLTLCCLLGCTTTAFAASDTAPYGYTYDDAVSGKTQYKFYCYNKDSNSYKMTRSFYSTGNTVCFSNGTKVTENSAGPGYRYNGFNTQGVFYSITKDGMLLGIGGNNKVITVLKSGAIELVYNADELAVSVKTSSGTYDLTNWTETPDVSNPTNPGTPGTNNPGNKTDRVEIYTNTAGEMVYDAYKGNDLKVSIVLSADGKHILNATGEVRLSDFLKGVKFMGIDTDYNVYMYETNGTLYRFTFGNWYSAEKISLGSAFKTFKTDDNGFLSQIVTETETFTIKQVTTSDKWKASKTYVVTKDVYATLYTKGTVDSHTLMLTEDVLTLDGTEVDDKVSAFGFISETNFCYIRNGRVYIAPISDPTDGRRFCSDASSFKRNDVGLVTSVVLTNGRTTTIA